MTNINTYIAVGLTALLLLLGSGTYIGWHLHKSMKPCPVVHDSTIVVTDPHWHHVADSLANLPPNVIIKWRDRDTIKIRDQKWLDSLLQANKVDTMAILREYYSIFEYTWSHTVKDTIDFNLKTTVTQNQPIKYDFSYKLLLPISTTTSTVDNSIHYTKYVYGGISYDIKVKSLSFNAFLATPKLLYGVGYAPNTNSFNATLSVKILQIK